MLSAILTIVILDLFIHIAQDARINAIEDKLDRLLAKSDKEKKLLNE